MILGNLILAYASCCGPPLPNTLKNIVWRQDGRASVVYLSDRRKHPTKFNPISERKDETVLSVAVDRNIGRTIFPKIPRGGSTPSFVPESVSLGAVEGSAPPPPMILSLIHI